MISENSFKSWRQAIRILFIFCLLLSLIFTIAYFARFHSALSRSHSSWGEFGSFFGGTIGSILSALNLFTLIYLTFKLNKGNKQEWLTDLRSPFYKSIIEKLYSFDPEETRSEGNAEELKRYAFWLTHLSLEDQLFLVTPLLRDETEQKKNALLDSLKSLEFSVIVDKKDFDLKYSSFTKLRTDFSKHLGNIMLNRTKLDLFG